MDALNSCLNFVDLDAIHIVDGAWKNGGNSPKSTDNTWKTVASFIAKHQDNINVHYYDKNEKIWESEGHKRNFQLKP